MPERALPQSSDRFAGFAVDAKLVQASVSSAEADAAEGEEAACRSCLSSGHFVTDVFARREGVGYAASDVGPGLTNGGPLRDMHRLERLRDG